LRSVAPYFSKIIRSASLGSPKTRKRSAEHVIVLQCIDAVLALTAIRCGAQNSAAIGDTADITGLEAAGGSIENDPKVTSAGSKFRTATNP
jgi:hypothetical protein